MTLRDEILASGLPLDDHGAIAAALSVGRTKIVPTEIGKGRILSTVGLDVGNALLDVIDTTPDFRHVKQLVENGWLDIGSPLARASLDELVPSVLTQTEADAIKALAEVPDTVTSQDVTKALEGV